MSAEALLRRLRDVQEAVERCGLQHIAIADLARRTTEAGAAQPSREAVLSALAEAILQAPLTLVIARAYRRHLLHIIVALVRELRDPAGSPARPARRDEPEVVGRCLSRLLCVAPHALSLVLDYYRAAPPPFERLLHVPAASLEAEQTPAEAGAWEELAATCHRFLRCAPADFRRLWDWTPALSLLRHRSAADGRAAELEELGWSGRRPSSTAPAARRARRRRARGGAGPGGPLVDVAGIALPRRVAPPGEPEPPAPAGPFVQTGTAVRNMRGLALAYAQGGAVLLEGPPGCGKTRLVEEFARLVGHRSGLTTVHLDDQMDSKLLTGTYVSTDVPGEFRWQPGVLTQAVREGRWLVFEDIELAPFEVVAALAPLLETRTLLLPARAESIPAHHAFRLFATRSTHPAPEPHPAAPEGPAPPRPALHGHGGHHGHGQGAGQNAALLENLWSAVRVEALPPDELGEVVATAHPPLAPLVPRLLDTYAALCLRPAAAGLPRRWTARDFLRACRRLASFSRGLPVGPSGLLTNALREDVFAELYDVFGSPLADPAHQAALADALRRAWELDPARVEHYAAAHRPALEAAPGSLTVGRVTLPVAPGDRPRPADSYAHTRLALRLMERVAACVAMNEPVLLVGETGTGKTSAAQALAGALGRRLVVLNLNQQSDAEDLLGGFRPVDAAVLAHPLLQQFDALFPRTFSRKANAKFIEAVRARFARRDWRALLSAFRSALQMADRRAAEGEPGAAPGAEPPKPALAPALRADWRAFAEGVAKLERQLGAGGAEGRALAFSFVEGALVRAVRAGDWLLLDEINLASAETLQRIAGLLDGRSIALTEKGEAEEVERHPEFRLVACMNPPTDAGKKDLPPQLKARFSEIYVPELEDPADLALVVRQHMRGVANAPADDIVAFYLEARKEARASLVDGANQRPQYSLRTLSRGVDYARAIAPVYGLQRALYEGFHMTFVTQLQRACRPAVEALLLSRLLRGAAPLASLLRAPPAPPEEAAARFELVEQFYLPRGPHACEPMGEAEYVLTPSIRANLRSVARVLLARRYPVLLQGPTSAGKTSMIEWLARRTGHRFVRVNNHEHTDVHEYLGQYVSTADGRLVFQEGVLVRAVREGHWILLDELNLAPSEVLEALNRLLDDNRELFIPETQEVVRPHPHFALFATQNPPGLYGGRKVLSRAFRNRFLEVHVDEIPDTELETIVSKRCAVAPSHAARLIAVMRDLQRTRAQSRLFAGKEGFITPRDLFRWASRGALSYAELAEEGYAVLAERLRRDEEKETVRRALEKHLKAPVDVPALYSNARNPDLVEGERLLREGAFGRVVWTAAMRRMFVLVGRGLKRSEPVLLVGETGTGKTTVCQMHAAVRGQKLVIVNCHQGTETADLIGGFRPVRGRDLVRAQLLERAAELLRACGEEGPALESPEVAAERCEAACARAADAGRDSEELRRLRAEVEELQGRYRALFRWYDGPLVEAMRGGHILLLDEISLADDSVLERVNSVLEPARLLVLAEKGAGADGEGGAAGAAGAEEIVAHADFRVVATMNPGGDYGKKELSPALRNRFTEIWVPSVGDAADLERILSESLPERLRDYAAPLLRFVAWFSEHHAHAVQGAAGGSGRQRGGSALSLRDLLAWAQFMAGASPPLAPHEAFLHGAALTLLDGLGLGTGLSERAARHVRAACLAELLALLPEAARAAVTPEERRRWLPAPEAPPEDPMELDGPAPPAPAEQAVAACSGDGRFGVNPFFIERGPLPPPAGAAFALGAPTTARNVLRLLRAVQLKKPVLLEGSPGVGKTSLVSAIGAAAGRRVVRINLSEQTDMMDLLGSDLPVEGGKGGEFVWKDGVFLQALKAGDWVLLDELNLASQSVLEGLNAVLDHRAEVFVPELGRAFACPPSFRIFACQNPVAQGGGRKGLPRSFLNRFSKVYVEALEEADLRFICGSVYPALDAGDLARMIEYGARLQHETGPGRAFGRLGAPWDFNLRDMFRWCDLLARHPGSRPEDFADLAYAKRLRTPEDRAAAAALFAAVFGRPPRVEPRPPFRVTPDELRVGSAALSRSRWRPLAGDGAPPRAPPLLLGSALGPLEALGHCVEMGWLAILVGPPASGKTSLVRLLAALAGAPLREMAVTSASDTSDLLGCFEQLDLARHAARLRLQAQAARLRSRNHFCGSPTDAEDGEQWDLIAQLLAGVASAAAALAAPDEAERLAAAARELGEEAGRVRRMCGAGATGSFEWMDGTLVEAMERGEWLLVEGANLCQATVLDRLNPLLEPGGTLALNERGLVEGRVKVVAPHPNFRLFFTVDPRHGEISRAMRNRGVELALDPLPCAGPDAHALLAARGLPGEDLAAAFCAVHAALSAGPAGGPRREPRFNLRHLLRWGALAAEQARRGLPWRPAAAAALAQAYALAPSEPAAAAALDAHLPASFWRAPLPRGRRPAARPGAPRGAPGELLGPGLWPREAAEAGHYVAASLPATVRRDAALPAALARLCAPAGAARPPALLLLPPSPGEAGAAGRPLAPRVGALVAHAARLLAEGATPADWAWRLSAASSLAAAAAAAPGPAAPPAARALQRASALLRALFGDPAASAASPALAAAARALAEAPGPAGSPPAPPRRPASRRRRARGAAAGRPRRPRPAARRHRAPLLRPPRRRRGARGRRGGGGGALRAAGELAEARDALWAATAGAPARDFEPEAFWLAWRRLRRALARCPRAPDAEAAAAALEHAAGAGAGGRLPAGGALLKRGGRPRVPRSAEAAALEAELHALAAALDVDWRLLRERASAEAAAAAADPPAHRRRRRRPGAEAWAGLVPEEHPALAADEEVRATLVDALCSLAWAALRPAAAPDAAALLAALAAAPAALRERMQRLGAEREQRRQRGALTFRLGTGEDGAMDGAPDGAGAPRGELTVSLGADADAREAARAVAPAADAAAAAAELRLLADLAAAGALAEGPAELPPALLARCGPRSSGRGGEGGAGGALADALHEALFRFHGRLWAGAADLAALPLAPAPAPGAAPPGPGEVATGPLRLGDAVRSAVAAALLCDWTEVPLRERRPRMAKLRLLARLRGRWAEARFQLRGVADARLAAALEELLLPAGDALVHSEEPELGRAGLASLARGRAWALLGLGKLRLLVGPAASDPAARYAAKAAALQRRVEDLSAEIDVRRAAEGYATGRASNARIAALEAERAGLLERLAAASEKVVARPPVPPGPSFADLHGEAAQACATLCDPPRVLGLLSALEAALRAGGRAGGAAAGEALKREAAWQDTAARVVERLQRRFRPFRDVAQPIALAIYEIKHGLRLAAGEVMEQARAAGADDAEAPLRLYRGLVAVPLPQEGAGGCAPLLASARALLCDEAWGALEALAAAAGERPAPLQAALLRVALSRLYLHAAGRRRLDSAARALLEDVAGAASASWRRARDAAAERKKAEEAAFEYKLRSHHVGTDEEREAAERRRMFPSYERDFADLPGAADLAGAPADFAKPDALPAAPAEEEAEEEGEGALEEESVWRGEALRLLQRVHAALHAAGGRRRRPTPTARPPSRPPTPPAPPSSGPRRPLLPPPAPGRLDEAAAGAHLFKAASVVRGLLAAGAHGAIVPPADLLKKRRAARAAAAAAAAPALQAAGLADEAPYDFYRDPNVALALPVVRALVERVAELAGQFPEHPTLQHLAAMSERILGFAVGSPVMRLLTGLEMLVKRAQEWEAFASRAVSLKPHTDALVKLIMRWRKLELQSWPNVLEARARAARERALAWWFHLHALVRCAAAGPEAAASAEAAAALAELPKAPAPEAEGEGEAGAARPLRDEFATLDLFLQSAPLGEYEARLQLLRAFAAQARAEPAPAAAPLARLLGHLCAYYGQFEGAVRARLEALRGPVAKALDEHCRIAKWDDFNYWSLKSSTEKSHRTLQRLARQFDEALNTPAAHVLGAARPALDSALAPPAPTPRRPPPPPPRRPRRAGAGLAQGRARAGGAADGEGPVPASAFLPPDAAIVAAVPEGAEPAGPLAGSAYAARLPQLARRSRQLLRAAACGEAAGARLGRTGRLLESLAAAVRKALTDLLRALEKGVGLSARPSSVPPEARAPQAWFEGPLVDLAGLEPPPAAPGAPAALAALRAAWARAEAYYWRGARGLQLLRRAAPGATQAGLPLREADRCSNFAEHLYHLLGRQRAELAAMAHACARLRSALEPWRRLASDPAAAAAAAPAPPSAAPADVVPPEAFPRREWPATAVALDAALAALAAARAALLADAPADRPAALLAPAAEAARRAGARRRRARRAARRGGGAGGGGGGGAGGGGGRRGAAGPMAGALDELVASALVAVQAARAAAAAFRSDAPEGAAPPPEEEEEGAGAGEEEEVDESDLEAHGSAPGAARRLAALFAALELPALAARAEALSALAAAAADADPAAGAAAARALAACAALAEAALGAGRRVALEYARLHAASGKLAHVLLALFGELFEHGFCDPRDQEQGDGDGSGKFEDDVGGTGIGAGEGKKDVSDQIEREEQVEGTRDEAEKEKGERGGEKKEEENEGLEMANDFDGEMHDVDREEGKDDEEQSERDEEAGLDREMQEIDPGKERVVDERLWNEEEDEREGREDEKFERDAPLGDEQETDEMRGKDEQEAKGKEDKADKGKKEQPKKEKGAKEQSKQGEEEEGGEEEGSEEGPDEAGINEDGEDKYEEQHKGAEAKAEEEAGELELPDDMDLDGGADEKEEKEAGADEPEAEGREEEGEDKGEAQGEAPPPEFPEQEGGGEDGARDAPEQPEGAPPPGADEGMEEEGGGEDGSGSVEGSGEEERGEEEGPAVGEERPEAEEEGEEGKGPEEEWPEFATRDERQYAAEGEEKQPEGVETAKSAGQNAQAKPQARPPPPPRSAALRRRLTGRQAKPQGGGAEGGEEAAGQEDEQQASQQRQATEAEGGAGEWRATSELPADRRPKPSEGGKRQPPRRAPDVNPYRSLGDALKRWEERLRVVRGADEAPPEAEQRAAEEEAAGEEDKAPGGAEEPGQQEEAPGEAEGAHEYLREGERDALERQALAPASAEQAQDLPERPPEGPREDRKPADEEEKGKGEAPDGKPEGKEEEEGPAAEEKGAADAPRRFGRSIGRRGKGKEEEEGAEEAGPEAEGAGQEDWTERDWRRLREEGGAGAGGDVRAEAEGEAEGAGAAKEEEEEEGRDEAEARAEREGLEEEMLGGWESLSPQDAARAEALWGRLAHATADLSRDLAEQLRLILAPTLAAKLQGDYRTGKRLNMKKVIGYVASGFRQDKIWLRRTKPSKRQYQVLIAIDDSESMLDSGSGPMACEALALIAKAMAQLEVGDIGVASFGAAMRLLHPLGEPFTDSAGAKVISQFTFKQRRTDVAALLESAVGLLSGGAHAGPRQPGGAERVQLLFVVSDGRLEEREAVRRWVREAMSRRIMVALLLLDAPAPLPAAPAPAPAPAQAPGAQAPAAPAAPASAAGRPAGGIAELQSVTFVGGKVAVVPYLEGYPFPYFVALRELRALPELLSDALRQWFELLQRA
eukprot:tig00000403_g342.t1